MVVSIPRGSLGSSCPAGLGGSEAKGREESVESCRIERHVGSGEVSALTINGLSSSGFVFLTRD